MAKTAVPTVDDDPQLPGMEDKKDAELIAAAKRHHTIKTQLKEAASDLQDSEEAVIKIMNKRGITKYRYKNTIIDLKAKQKIAVKIEPPKESGDEVEE